MALVNEVEEAHLVNSSIPPLDIILRETLIHRHKETSAREFTAAISIVVKQLEATQMPRSNGMDR